MSPANKKTDTINQTISTEAVEPPSGGPMLRHWGFSKIQLLVFVLVFGLIGGFLVWKSFAAGPVVASFEAEQMAKPHGGYSINDTKASGGKAAFLGTEGSASGTFVIPDKTRGSSLAVVARGSSCRDDWPMMKVVIDGQKVMGGLRVSSTNWKSYAVNKTLGSGSHRLVITFSNDLYVRGVCDRNLFIDKTVFYGSLPAPAPTVSLSASPPNINSGQASTLTWNSINATSCSASGGWSGSQPTAGSLSTGALNSNTAYTLACNGPGGQATATTTVGVTSLPPKPVTYDSPIVITKGGTYTGNWQSNDPNTPAVTISTTEPVIIQSCRVRSKGELFRTVVGNNKLTIRNCYAVALNPDQAAVPPGYFLIDEWPDSLVIQNNYIEGTSGIQVSNYGDDFPTNGQSIKITNNRVKNIDGRKSDGHGGFSQTDYSLRHFVILDKVHGIPGIDIGWNEIINEPRKSRTEDVINMYLSSGTSSSPIQIHDNYIQGAYPTRPESDGYAGGGIMVGDGNTSDSKQASAYIKAENNQVISTTNYGIAIAAGHDLQFSNNRIVSSGRLVDGTFIAAQNIAFYVWNAYRSSVWSNNYETNNLAGWVRNATGTRNDWWLPGCESDSSGPLCRGNVAWPGTITAQTEAAEFTSWQGKIQAAKTTIGPDFSL